MATVSAVGTVTWNTTAGNKTVVATPSAGVLIVVIAATSGLAGGTISVTDNQTGGTYAQIHTDFTGFSTTGVLTAWVRNRLVPAASSTTWTATQTGSSGGGLRVFQITGMSIVGLGAIRGAGGQSSGTAATTPAPILLRRVGTTFSGTQAALTANAVIGAVANGTNPAGLAPRGAPVYTESNDSGYNSPATGLETMFISSGETASTITWGGNSASAFASIAIEIDASVPKYDWVVTGPPNSNLEHVLPSAVGRASSW